MQKYYILPFSLFIIASLILAGCFQGEQSLEEVDPPQGAEPVDNKEDGSSDKGEENETDTGEEETGTTEEETEANENENADDMDSETVARQLYLLDVNGMIASQTLELPNLESKEVATQVLEYLVKEGPVTSILPNGFQPILPAGTEVLGLDLQEDGTLIVDVSKEFENYEAEDELKILQSMTYTLTQFDSVDDIQLWINGYPHDEMPVNGTPITDGYSRVNGINIIETDTIDLLNSKAVTMFYPSEYNDNQYYIPITQHVETDDEDVYGAIVDALIAGPGHNMNVSHVFNSDTSLIDKPTLKNGVLELTFGQEILQDADKAIISDEVMETLVRTLTEQHSVESVDVKVEDIDKLTSENGETYDEPVTNELFMETGRL